MPTCPHGLRPELRLGLAWRSAGWELASKQPVTSLRLTLPSLVSTAGLMVKKSASDVSISSGTHGQYSILQTARLLPGAPQQAVSSVFGSQQNGPAFQTQGTAPWFIFSPQALMGLPLLSEHVNLPARSQSQSSGAGLLQGFCVVVQRLREKIILDVKCAVSLCGGTITFQTSLLLCFSALQGFPLTLVCRAVLGRRQNRENSHQLS